MSQNMDDLYQQVLLDHNKKPRNFGDLPHATHQAEGFNPLCGDHMWVYLALSSDNKISEVKFKGNGCAISKASTSMMTEAIKGKTVDEARNLFSEFMHLVKGELDPDKAVHHLGKLRLFKGIWHFPARVKCAALGWHAMQSALSKEEKRVTTEIASDV